MRLLLALTALASTQARLDEGYLFVTNRGDEAVFSARSVRAVAPRANITFVSDAATLRDVGGDLGVFDVIIEAEKAMPDVATHSSQGFRLQKLRGGLVSPYERTIFMDSDTFACKDPGATLFPLLRGEGRREGVVGRGAGRGDGAPDVAMVFGSSTGASEGSRDRELSSPGRMRNCLGKFLRM